MSIEHGLSGRRDRIETEGKETAVVEYKSTPARRRATITGSVRVQLSLQVIALREAGNQVLRAAVHFVEHGLRIPVAMGTAEIGKAVDHANRVKPVIGSRAAPEPLEDDPRCRTCSHAGVCLPDERALALDLRRILVADPDSHARPGR